MVDGVCGGEDDELFESQRFAYMKKKTKRLDANNKRMDERFPK